MTVPVSIPDLTICRFFVRGNPRPQPRPKATRVGAFVRIVSIRQQDKAFSWREAVRAEGQRAMADKQRVDSVAIRLELVFLMERPAALSKPKWADRFVLVNSGKDCDNLAKLVQDALNGVVWKDDRLISTLIVRKQYLMPHESPGVRVTATVDVPEQMPFWP